MKFRWDRALAASTAVGAAISFGCVVSAFTSGNTVGGIVSSAFLLGFVFVTCGIIGGMPDDDSNDDLW